MAGPTAGQLADVRDAPSARVNLAARFSVVVPYRAVVDQVLEPLQHLRGDLRGVGALREVPAQEHVAVLAGAALVGAVRIGEAHRAADGGGDVLVSGKLLAVVDRQRVHWLAREHVARRPRRPSQRSPTAPAGTARGASGGTPR